jgi:tetratricopeptide (TPR) repeat protein
MRMELRRAHSALAAVVLVAAVAGAGRAAGTAEARRHYAKGAAAYDVGDFKEAIDHFKAAYKVTPEAVFLFNIAQSYRQLKDREQAKFFYRSYLRNAPSDAANRADAERWLAELDQAGGAAAPAPPPARTPPAPSPPAQPRMSAPCAGVPVALDFEDSPEGAEIVTTNLTAFRALAIDHSRAFCGKGSLRVDASFDLSGVRNQHGTLPNQAGQLQMMLKDHVDLTNRTVTIHVYADTASTGATFGVSLFAVNKGTWVDGKFFQPLAPGKWWTITATFKEANRLYSGGTSPADDVDAIALQVTALGSAAQRTWSGRIYLDGLGWQ